MPEHDSSVFPESCLVLLLADKTVFCLAEFLNQSVYCGYIKYKSFENRVSRLTHMMEVKFHIELVSYRLK